jgi:RHS repeat-associated protein
MAGGVTGNGVIRANGGNAGSSAYGGHGGGGAGGHITIDMPVAANTFTGTVSAFGGSGYQVAGAGTIYWAAADKLVVDNNALAGRNTILYTADYDFSEIDIRRSGTLRILGALSSLTINNTTLSGDGTGRLEMEGTVHAPATFTMNGVMLAILNRLDGPMDITTQTNGGLELHASTMPSGIYDYNNVTVGSGSTLRLVSYDNGDTDYTNDYGVTLQVVNLTVQAGGMVESNGQGYPSASGPGKGTNGGPGGGAGHGGLGGNSAGGQAGGSVYGDIYEPTTLGSGGGNGVVLGGEGGGAVKLIVSETLQVNGAISANGNNGRSEFGGNTGGGGSGGSIWIMAGGVTGNGVIRANGGNAGSSAYGGHGGGGAGGRIAVYTDSLASTVQLSVIGGSGYQKGGDGTIYLDGLDPSLSTLTVDPQNVLADGASIATVTVTLKNADGIPVPNRAVEIAVASGNGLLINDQAVNLNQYVAIGNTDENGVATATLKATTAGTRVIAARSGQELIIQQGAVEFIAVGDLSLSMSAPANTIRNAVIDYIITIQQSLAAPAEDVTLELQLPADVSYVSQNSAVEPTQDGQTLTWDFGTFSPGQSLSFVVSGHVSAAATVGSTLLAQASVTTSSAESNQTNNNAAAQTTVVDGLGFSVYLTPASRLAAIGAPATYEITIKNTGLVQDTYTVSVDGLNSEWHTLSQTSVSLLPGGIAVVSLAVQTDSCTAAGSVSFDVEVTSSANQQMETKPASITFQTAPQVSGLVPWGGQTLGSRDVTINWQTDVPTTGVLTVFPSGSPQDADTFPTLEGTSHSIVVPGLERNTIYEWFVEAASDCGITTLPQRTFTVGNGIVFVNRSKNVTIDRDYDQRVSISVRNDDHVAHTLTTSMLNPNEDILVNFVDSGSVDQTITLQPGETRQVTVAINAQDAAQSTYTLTGSLISDEGGTQIHDNMTLHVTVLSEGDFTIEEVAFDEITLARTYEITNRGKPITDLSLQAVDPVTGEPARIFLQPNLDHARLDTGQTIRVIAYPIFTADDAAAQASSQSKLASSLPAVSPIHYDLQATGAGVPRGLSNEEIACGGGRSIMAVMMQDCSMTFETQDWYCTNRPDISTPIPIPAFLTPENITSASLNIVYSPRSNVQPHSGLITFNGSEVGSYSSQVPSGQFSFDIPASTFQSSVAGSALQTVDMYTEHPNPGHYVSATGYKLNVGINQATTYVCADSQVTAQQIVKEQYACSATYSFNWLTDVSDLSTNFSCNNGECGAAGGSTGATESVCGIGTTCGTQGTGGDPINTRTGAFSAAFSDLSFPTMAGELIFQRSYSSSTTGIYSTPLGYGWMFNHDTRLIFPDAPNGMEGFVLFQAPTGNQYLFKIEANDIYTPGPGVTASLVKSPIAYTVTTSQQDTYVFDLDGRLVSRANDRGHAFAYAYDSNGRLTRVSADQDSRYLQIEYDSQGRIVSVSDHAGRQVSYGYNAAGDLAAVTDVLGQNWVFGYDAEHRLTEIRDSNGEQTLITEYDLQGRAYRQFDGNGKLVTNIVYNADGSATVYDALGQAERHRYDSRNTLTSSTSPMGAAESKTYDGNFRPATITDPLGNMTALTWSGDGSSLTRVVDAQGNETQITYDALNNPVSVVDPQGSETVFAYDGSLLTAATDALNQTTTYAYTPEGWLASTTDPLGNTTSYTYNSHGQRTSMTDPLGNTWTYAYDALGRLTDTTDPRGRVTHSEYDAAGRLTSQTVNYDASKSQNEDNLWNIVASYTYDSRGNQTSVTDTFGRVTQYEYDHAGQLVKTIDPVGSVTVNTYNNAGQLIATTDALGRVTQYKYDAAGRLIKTIDPLGNTTTIAYNADGSVAGATDALGRATSYQYDALKRVIAVTLPNGGTTHNSYDEIGNLIATTDALGNVTQYEYDALGRLIKTIDPLDNFIETFYDSAGRVIQTRDANGNATSYAYDAAGRQTSVTDALGNATSYQYDPLGRRIATTDANGNVTTYTYDELNRTATITDSLGNSTTATHDALGQTLTRTDANGNSVNYAYDVLNRLVSQGDALGGVTAFQYDAAGNRTAVTDANGRISTTSYDALNRPVTVTDANGNATTNGYDAAGNLVASTDALGNTTVFAYNALNQPILTRDALGNQTVNAYNLRGELVLTTDANGVTTAYAYDALGRLTAVIENYAPPKLPDHETNVRTEYTYDAVGNRLTITDGSGHTTSFTYDGLNRLTSETDPLGHTWGYAYDSLGNRISMTDANGATTTYTYDNANRLATISYPDSTVTFSYDAGGRRLSMTDEAGATQWIYNPLNQVTAITDPFGQTVSYSYDSVGNRATLAYPDGTQVDYGYDPANRLVTVNGLSSTVSYQYDAANRLTNVTRPNDVNTTYAYDTANRLLSITHGSGLEVLSSYQYSYDNVGNRVQAVEQWVTNAGAGPTVHLTVADNTGALMTGREVYVFDGDTYSGYHATTDENGQVAITLPQGSYRFRVDVDGTQFWSGAENHCTIGECDNLLVTVTAPTLVHVSDSNGVPQANVPVYAFIGTQYASHHGTTDENGNLSLRLPQGTYRMRADFGGTQFWSADVCNVPSCWEISITVNQPVTVTVLDNVDMPHAGVEVYAFDGTTYTGKHAATDENGQAQFTLMDGEYRFRADFDGTQFWSGAENHCTVPACGEAGIAVTLPLVVTVMDGGGAPQQGISVYAFNESTYTGFNGITDVDGRVFFTLPAGNYRFRADLNGTQFWSGTANHCAVPDCSGAQVTVTSSTTVTVIDEDNAPKAGVKVYAFNGATYSGYSATTDANGQVSLTLPQGSYRFRADYNGTQFWSGTANHCEVPGCTNASVSVTNGVLVTVTDTDDAPQAGLKVYAFDGATYTGYNATTDANGQVVFTLPHGSYRFRADYNGTQFWSGISNHCDIPGCSSAGVTVSIPLTLTVQTADETPQSGIKVYAFNGTTYTGYNATTGASGQAEMTLPLGSYRFRVDYNGAQYWSGTSDHCDIPGCLNQTVIVGPQPTATPTSTPEPAATETPSGSGYQPSLILAYAPHGTARNSRLLVAQPKPQSAPPNDVTITVLDTDDDPKEGLRVYVFDETTYTGFNGTTGENGQVLFTLPDGDYRFRADLNGTQFWSNTANHCAVPGCDSVAITVTKPVTITVQDMEDFPKAGVNVYAFDGSTYTGYHSATDANGQASLTLPLGSYRFRADYNGTQFWSSAENHCDVTACGDAIVTVANPLAVTVLDTDATPRENLKVYAFDSGTYSGYHAVTDANGLAVFTLPFGTYHFRADFNGTQFWSGEENHCDTSTGCGGVGITVTKPVLVTVANASNTPYADLPVYAFSGSTYSGYHGVTDANGFVTFTLPAGEYRFRADLHGVPYWSNSSAGNDCSIPGCESVKVIIPGGFATAEVTIDYVYDPLYRLTEANYSNGDYYHYAYDPVGNRLAQDHMLNGQSSVVNYTYDNANRLASAGGVTYTFDANGNLLSDGVNTYTYDSANRLISVNGTTTYQYNGLGDRISQTANGMTTNYTLDLNTGLTQVLSDGTTDYLYGNGRIAQMNTTAEYFLGDALGSVRQMTDATGAITFTRGYDPYGVVTYTTGASQTEFGFTGEQYVDSTQLLYLRARHYSPTDGRFTSRDTWSGDVNRPLSLNRWMYVEGNPVNRVDPTGHTPISRGYMEGYSFSAGILEGNIQGKEIVYDYATMTRARFTYTGMVGLALASIDGAVYNGVITGFRYEPKPKSLLIGLEPSSNLPYSLLIEKDYSGPSEGAYGGIDPTLTPGLGFSGGAGYFQSLTTNIKGVFSYVSLGAGIPVEVVGFQTVYEIDPGSLSGHNNSGIEYYYDPKTARVDRGKLISDILTGDHSPIPGRVLPTLTAWLGSVRTAQVSVALTAATRFEKYYYQPNYGQCRDGQVPLPPLPYPPFEIPLP